VRIEATPWLRFRFAGLADGLAADRNGTVRAANADTLEAWIEASGAFSDLRVGMGRLAWGRLDEIQPTDVINPIDVSRFLLEGRSEARIAVPLVRARLLPSDRLTIEAVLVPYFRRGRFDRLDEASSPFNLLADRSPAEAVRPGLCGVVLTCADRWSFSHQPVEGRLQGGARVAATSGRVDWSLSAWRGFLPFGLVAIADVQNGKAALSHGRFTMLGADVETVKGKWAVRGELAFFPNRPTQGGAGVGIFASDAVEAGAGVDRRAGDFTLSATVLLRRDHLQYRVPEWPGPRESYRILEEPVSNVSLVTGFSRTYNRDRVETRMFALINPADEAGFLRGVLSWKPFDDVAVETSVGWFVGDGDDVITQFGDRDFGYVRLKYFFGR
jgi:hypothetical protein